MREVAREDWHLIKINHTHQASARLAAQLDTLGEAKPKQVRGSSSEALAVYAAALEARADGVQAEFNYALESTSWNPEEHIRTGGGYRSTRDLWWLGGKRNTPTAGTIYGNNVVKVWDEMGITGHGVSIAVLDVGFLPDDWEITGYNPVTGFGGRWIMEYSFDTRRLGYDASADETGDDNDGRKYHGYGSSSIALGSAGNQYGGAGVAHNATPILFRLGRDPHYGLISYYDAGVAVDTAIAWGASVINMSFGVNLAGAAGVPNSYLGAALQRSVNAGLVNVAAMGNENRWVNSITYPWFAYPVPASWPTVIGVGAATANGWRASYSNYGPRTGIWASIQGTGGGTEDQNFVSSSYVGPDPVWASCYWTLTRCKDQPGQTMEYNGTSSAAPVISGIAALMQQVNPNLNHYQIHSIMSNTARRDLPDANVNEGGLVDAYEAVKAAQNFQ